MAAPFEPLESAPEEILTLKVTLLLALTSLKRVGDLPALSVSKMCMDFALGLVKMTLRPRPGYVPKVLSTSFRSQVVTFFRGVLLEDICVAAGWSSLHTFIRFYNLDLDTAPGSQVLSV